MAKYFFPFCFFFLTIYGLDAQTQFDTIHPLYTATPVVIDGSSADACWAKAEWRPIDQVWIPFGEVMKPGDFKGRFKLAWDVNYLYVLAEIEDDIISDDHPNPLDNWWNDDCLELFIDEDRSKGNHECTYNAFAYHVSLYRDAIDMGTNCAGINLKNNLSIVMDTIGPHLYLWELAVKMYDKNFNPNNPETSRVKLYANKLMGFSIAYCDNDETTTRENFIGSMILTKETANESYKNADYFGPVLLVDPNNELVSAPKIQAAGRHFTFYPNPVKNNLIVEPSEDFGNKALFEVISMNGAVVKQFELTGQQQEFSFAGLPKGIYAIKITGDNFIQIEKITKE
jgi:hypothetical protein